MIQRCEADHGSGNCEKSGLIYYPKCTAGYSASGCCICRPSFSSCTAEGYATDAKLDLSCRKDIKIGDPTPLEESEESCLQRQDFSYPDPAELQYTAPDALTNSSKSWLAKRFMDNELLTKNIAYLKDCGTNCDESYVTIVTGKFSWDTAKDKCDKMNRRLCPRSAICPSGESGEPLGGNREKKELWAPFGDEGSNQWINIGIKDARANVLCYDNSGFGNTGEIVDVGAAGSYLSWVAAQPAGFNGTLPDSPHDTEVYCCSNTPAGYLTTIAELQTRQADYFDTGLSMDSIDKSISLVFGDKTTIGQVCAYSKGLTSIPKTVVDIPGFCCLDAPYKARTEEWGEKVRA